MSKYICVSCAMDFKSKKGKELHQKLWPSHLMATKLWRARFWDWFFNYPWGRFFRFVGVYLIYMVIVKHFNIDFDMLESMLIGLGLGLAID